MQTIIDPFVHRRVGRCFYLAINLTLDDDEIYEEIQKSMRIEQATNLLLEGRISHDDFLDIVEEDIVDIDGYIEEINLNLQDLG